MAKKKVTKSDIISAGEVDSLTALYILLGYMGVATRKDDFVVPYEYKKSRVSIAIPAIKYGVAFQSDDSSELEEEGWHVEHVSSMDMEPFARIFRAADNARIAKTYALVDPNVKTTSIPEEKIYVEIQRRVLPLPDRNYKFVRDDGTELTTPDFTWEKQRVAFFMDGSYWHSMKSDQEIIRAIKNDKSKKLEKSIIATRKDKVNNDKKIRSELASRGWHVISCTDDDLETPDGVSEVVDMIERTLKLTEYASTIQDGSDQSDAMMNDIIMGVSSTGDVQPSSAPSVATDSTSESGTVDGGDTAAAGDASSDDADEFDADLDAGDGASDVSELVDDELPLGDDLMDSLLSQESP